MDELLHGSRSAVMKIGYLRFQFPEEALTYIIKVVPSVRHQVNQLGISNLR